MSKHIVVLGSTGSIGTQSLMVCKNLNYSVAALAACSNVKLLEEQARQFRPGLVVIQDESRYPALKRALADTNVHVAAGSDAVCEAAALPEADLVINAIVGIAGLRPTLAALEAGKRLALSNKEALIAGGELVMETARRMDVPVIPVDSEHSAIFQCLRAGRREDVAGIILTASGGPFVGKTKRELAGVGISQALAHPNWSMGAKITIDSATMMNKGLEYVEAMWLFDLTPDQIEIVIHRQSAIHSAVEFADGAVIAQLGVPDMRVPIQYAATYPDRYPTGGVRLSLTQYGSFTFEEPDYETFACLKTMVRAAREGGLAPCVANGANEAAVALFLGQKIPFLEIGELVQAAFEAVKLAPSTRLEDIEAADRAAREFVCERARLRNPTSKGT